EGLRTASFSRRLRYAGDIPDARAASTAESSRTSRACRSAFPIDGAITLHYYSWYIQLQLTIAPAWCSMQATAVAGIKPGGGLSGPAPPDADSSRGALIEHRSNR